MCTCNEGNLKVSSVILYRPDIDGLRALAVLSVIIFHLEPSYLRGGFLGVDVFFVISGYLITSIIYKQINKDTFSFSSFYVKRAKRILPPMFFTLSLTTIFCYIVLLPYDFYKFGITLISVMFFASNVQYSLRTGDYFSGDSSEWPLLHTWSLAAEEQYYFVLPLLLLGILKYRKNLLVTMLILFSILSFLIAEYMSSQRHLASFSYYLIVSRMGEMLVGSVLAVCQANGHIKAFRSNILAYGSLALILLLMVVVNETTRFPGLVALALCLPVAIIINSQNTHINKLFALRPIVYVGLLSYSLYLVHWPVMALSRYLLNSGDGDFSFTLTTQAYIVVLIVILSLFSYYLIEKPLRQNSLQTKSVFAFYFAVPSLIFIVIGGFIITSKGAPERIDTQEVRAGLQYSHIDKSVCPSLVNLGCKLGDVGSSKRIVFYGNSHAEHYAEYLSLIGKNTGQEVSLYASGGCNLLQNTSKCNDVTNTFIKEKGDAESIVIAYRWDNSYKNTVLLAKLEALLSSLLSQHKRVVVLAQPPLLSSSPSKISNCLRLNVKCGAPPYLLSSYPEYNGVIERLVNNVGAEFFDPYAYVSDKSALGDGVRLYYSDADHLSVYGARWLYNEGEEKLIQIFQNE
ncbi:acyltransferase family protein [Agaribacter flavus]|uniref:Acyltransferase family protein n=1 Tax=Agaribacter flavus TaxID=1902781 RepID=A0ABV7FR03_9ALTE